MKLKSFLGGILLLFLMSCNSVPHKYDYFEARNFFGGAELTENVIPYFYYQDQGMWNHIYDFSSPFLIPDATLKSIIIPHHDITVAEQNSFYSAISERQKPDTVVVICPDHYEEGTNYITVPDPDTITFDSPEEIIQIDKELLAKVADSPLIKEYINTNNSMWLKEHGVFVHTPFIGHYFPGAKILPVALRPECRNQDFEVFKKLAQVLSEATNNNTLIIASVDFSHYQVPRMTNIHDVKTLNTIANFESPEHIEVDSPESLTCIMEYSRITGNTTPVLFHTTSTFDYVPKDDIISTSHQYWGFYNTNDKETEEAVKEYFDSVESTSQRFSNIDYKNTLNQTLLISGSGSPAFGIRTFVNWDRYETSTNKGDINTRKLAGEEARFLKGFDAYIFDCLSDEAVTENDIFIFPRENDCNVVKRILDQNLHGTNLFVEECPLTILNQNTVNDIISEKKKHNSIGVLVLSDNSEKNPHVFNENFLEPLYSLYDIVIVRDNTGTRDTYVYLKDGKKKITLGILFNAKTKETEKDSLLAIVFKNSSVSYELF